MHGQGFRGVDADRFASIVRSLAVGVRAVAEDRRLDRSVDAQRCKVDLHVARRPVRNAADVPRRTLATRRDDIFAQASAEDARLVPDGRDRRNELRAFLLVR